VVLTKFAGLSEEDAQLFNGLFAIIAVSIFLSFGSMQAEWERLSASAKRQKWHFWLALKRWYCQLMLGREPEHVTVQNVYNGTIDGLSVSALEKALRNNQLVTA
jgi:hypothetical protein